MSTYCPVCNGLQTLSAACPRCLSLTNDHGRYNDYFGPYSPYRPIEDISQTNGYPDLRDGMCLHLLSCEECGCTFPFGVKEI